MAPRSPAAPAGRNIKGGPINPEVALVSGDGDVEAVEAMVFNIPAAGGAITGKGTAASSPSAKLMSNRLLLDSNSLTPHSGDLSSAPISELDMGQVEQIVHDQLSRSVELQQQAAVLQQQHPGSSSIMPPCGADMSMELDPASEWVA